MKIRSVTIFNGRADARTKPEIERAGKAATAIRTRLVDTGFEVQTTRLALAPAYRWTSSLSVTSTVLAAQQIEAMANESGIDYVSIGPVAMDAEHVSEIDKLPELIARTRVIFASAVIAKNWNSRIINFWALWPIAVAIKEIAARTENGFGNLRFAALAQCDSGIPFFPAAYAFENEFSFALAMESADLALDAVSSSLPFPDAMKKLTGLIERKSKMLSGALAGHFTERGAVETVVHVEQETGAQFTGFDWSLATHPDASCSIGAAIEKSTGARFGECGTLTAIAGLTAAIKAANVRHVGFSGVFLPLLEDAVLAARTSDSPDLQKLLLYCSVCGSGLDTIPLAGDVSEQSLAALLGDVATLATSLNKPLTARLMPVPGLKAGEKTRFDFPYLVNGHALRL